MINKKMIDEFEAMDITALREINHVVVQMINRKASYANASLSISFRVGDKVAITSRRKGRQEGVITKINRTKAIVSIDGAKWDCPFSLLKKA